MKYYHACPKTDTESILKEGLLRSKSSLWKKSGGAIYLTKEPIWKNKSKEHNVLEVNIPNDYYEVWKKGDEQYSYKTRKEMWEGSNGWEWIAWFNIPAEFIKVKNRRKSSG